MSKLASGVKGFYQKQSSWNPIAKAVFGEKKKKKPADTSLDAEQGNLPTTIEEQKKKKSTILGG